MRTHDIATLPLWARKRFEDYELQLSRLRRDMDALQAAHALLASGRQWFTIPGPPLSSVYPLHGKDCYRLWFLSADGALPACSLYVGDVLLVGRQKKEIP
jgi:hypothetical protein